MRGEQTVETGAFEGQPRIFARRSVVEGKNRDHRDKTRQNFR